MLKFVVIALLGSCVNGQHPIILLVLDGMRHDYLSAYSTPNLDQILSQGVLAPRLQTEFPSFRESFLTSLLTGHYTEDHGIQANEVFFEPFQSTLSIDDPNFWNATKNLGTLLDLVPQFYACNWPLPLAHLVNDEYLDHFLSFHSVMKEMMPLGHPKNITTQNNTITSNSSSSQHQENTDLLKKNNSSSIEDNWNTCLEFMMQKLENVEDDKLLVSMFVDDPGRTAEIYGPESSEVGKAIEKVDDFVGKLVKRLMEKKLWQENVNLIITSTPGYSDFTYDHMIDLSTILKNPKQYMLVGNSPVLNIKPLDKELMVYEELKKGEAETGSYKVFIKEEFPEASHYAANENVQELIVVANEGFAFAHDMRDRVKFLNQLSGRKESLKNVYGVNGYNNTYDSMMTFIIANGPDMANHGKSIQVPLETQKNAAGPFQVIDIFSMICQILDVQVPKPAQGENWVASLLLRYPSDPEVVKLIRNWLSEIFSLKPENMPITIGIVSLFAVVTLLLLTCLVCIAKKCCRRKKDALKTTGYRYTQVKNNRRVDDQTDVHFEGMNDDKQGLLTEVAIDDDNEEEA